MSHTGSRQKRRSVLIVGNRTQDMLALSMMLQLFDYDPVSASTAAQALDRLSVASPALIITDTTLPGMSGLDLFELIRQDRRLSHIPVLFMIFPGDAATERRCYGVGAAGCVMKPVQAEELYRSVQEAIEPRPRSNIRIEARIPVALDNVPLECPEGGCRVKLSTRGMYIPMHKPYPRNKRVSVKINLGDRTIDAEGTVLHSHAHGVGTHKYPGMGIKFTTITHHDQELIRTFIREEISRDVRAGISRQVLEREP